MADADGEERTLSPDEQARAEFDAEMDDLIELNSRDWSVPERTAEQEEEPHLHSLDAQIDEGLADVAEHNRRTAESYRKQVDSGEAQPHEARKRIQEQTKDIEKIHRDFTVYRNECARKFLEITQQMRAGEISEFQGEEVLKDEISRESRKKITRLGLLSVGMDWTDMAEMSDDFLNLVPDGYSPEYREKRKALRKKFATLTPEEKRGFSRQIDAEAEATGDHAKERLLYDHVKGYWHPEY